ncbi:capsular biosynthesis protein [Pedobacter psychrophilus]|uniref:protein-tyrosine-phosphatase n=1 Tax=Pedobacter psychrophilus TaxID=1826909 RepID=A0A179DDI7_9SPHI|nr:CpsB/CapC family capsule biosynthesis tyrosine phosphatase [Pedobacter psychrophilus]OAQ38533.1 capsular biosynthesis protein [Pedobacter psychrophilus]
MFGLFKPKKNTPEFNFSDIGIDMHSHILPGIDDGAPTVKESIMMVKRFQELGFKKLIATPHIMADYYRNTPDTINKALDELREELVKQNIYMPIEAAAEYYLDETFETKINKGNLMTMGKDYILFELSYINYPNNIKDIIQKLTDKGLKPILAHPERYLYLGSIENYYKIKEYGCYFQLNTISLSGYYGKQTQKIAEELVDNMMIDFIGSDMHHLRHADALHQSLFTPSLKTLFEESALQNVMLV